MQRGAGQRNCPVVVGRRCRVVVGVAGCGSLLSGRGRGLQRGFVGAVVGAHSAWVSV